MAVRVRILVVNVAHHVVVVSVVYLLLPLFGLVLGQRPPGAARHFSTSLLLLLPTALAPASYPAFSRVPPTHDFNWTHILNKFMH